MRAEYTTNGSVLKIYFSLQGEEGQEMARGIQMANNELEIRLTGDLDAKKIHNDHLALITILSVHPFVRNNLLMDLEVSSDFAKTVEDRFAYKINFTSTKGIAYVSSKDSKPCLAFSGGVDSTAALMLMPKNTICAWLDRPQLAERTLYNKTAAKYTMEYAKKLGYEVHKVYCDIEHIRKPVGFPVDLTSGMTAIAIASQRDVDSIAYGMVMESAYRTGHAKFRDYPRSFHYKSWAPLFAAAGIPLHLPVGGVSEVGTSKIVLESEFNGAARSCIRGEWPDPCNNCWKCFRKTLVDNRLLGIPSSESSMTEWVKVREVKYKLKSWPVSHENVLAWALKGANVSGATANSLLARLEGSRRELNLLSRWYPPSIELIPEKYRESFKLLISNYLETMSTDEITQSESLDISDWLGSDIAGLAREEFEKIVNPSTNQAQE